MTIQQLERIELNIALVPDAALNAKLVDVSYEFTLQWPAIVRLGGDPELRLATAAHLTLLQLPLPITHLTEGCERLRLLAVDWAAFYLKSTDCFYNEHEGSLEMRFKTSERLIAAQTAVISELNELRGGLLLDRDPAGNVVHDLLEAPGELGDNIRAYGYAEVGGLFRPHVTLNWFPLTATITQRMLPHFKSAEGNFSGLAVYAMGPYGTCPQRLAYYPLAA